MATEPTTSISKKKKQIATLLAFAIPFVIGGFGGALWVSDEVERDDIQRGRMLQTSDLRKIQLEKFIEFGALFGVLGLSLNFGWSYLRK